jgi:hypothetical protein
MDASSLNKGPIEIITIVGHKDCRLYFLNVGKESLKQSPFIRLIVDDEWTRKFFLWSILKVLNIFRDNLSVGDEITLAQFKI